MFVPYYASVEQLTSNSWVDQTHVTKSTVLNLTKTDAVEVKWEANALLAGGRWVTSQEELQTVCSYLRSRAEDGGAAPDGRGLQRARMHADCP